MRSALRLRDTALGSPGDLARPCGWLPTDLPQFLEKCPSVNPGLGEDHSLLVCVPISSAMLEATRARVNRNQRDPGDFQF